MRHMADNAIDDILNDQSRRVRLMLQALIGDADQTQLVDNFRTISGLGNVNTPRMKIYCNDDHFEVQQRSVNGNVQPLRHDTDNDLWFRSEGDANGRLCSAGGGGVMGYRYGHIHDPTVDFIVFCDKLFDEMSDGRVPGLDLAQYSVTDQSTGVRGEPGLDRYHLVSATILHEMTHTAVSGLRTEDVMVTYTPVGQTGQVTQKAYGYAKCRQLKLSRPEQVLNNADTYATLAIALYMSANNWAWGYAKPVDA
ncbi:hypothetical protein DL98DRAFT_588764 [Cadophora sp. DSE1049]|nr:hypothetical protein DL98DRAFT_588764 [Cadophora sp. DSE1049]